MTRARRWAPRLLALAAGATGGPLAVVAFAQSDAGPVVVGRRDAFRAFNLEHLSAAIELYAEDQRDEIESEGRPDRTDTETTLRSDLELSGRGFIGHRDLVDLNAVVRLGLEQIDTDSGGFAVGQDVNEVDNFGLSREDTNTRIFFDINALILAQSDTPLTLYARRDQVTLNREFSSDIDSTNTEIGAMLRLRIKDAPTFIHAFHREIDQDDRLDVSDFDVTQDTVIVRSNISLSDNQSLIIENTFDSVEESQAPAFENSFTRNDLLVQHQVNFGPDDSSFLRSTGRIFDETGEFAFRRYRIDELLRLEHSDDFETRYNLNYEEQDRQSERQEFLRGSVTARRQFFDSLVATVTGGGSDLEIDDGFESQEVFGDINLRYTKRVPYGRFHASGGVGFNQEDNSARGNPTTVRNLPIVFPDALPAVIDRTNVDPASIVVRDAAGLQVFIEGVDYTVRLFPDRIELRRVVGGDISPGETTLVDFTVGPEPAATIDTLTSSIALRYTIGEGFLAGLSPYLEYQEINRSIDSRAPELFLVDDVRDLTYGLEYRRGPFAFLAEQEHRESEFSPFDQTRIEGRYEQRLGRRSRVSLNLTHEEIEFTNEDETTTLNRAIFRYDGNIRENLQLGLHLELREEDSDNFGDSTGFEQDIELIWRRGRTTIEVSFSNAILDSDIEDRTSQTFIFSLRREF